MYPILSDFWPHGETAQKYGVLTDSGFCDRAIFIVNKEGDISYIDRPGFKNVPDNEIVFAELSKLA